MFALFKEAHQMTELYLFDLCKEDDVLRIIEI